MEPSTLPFDFFADKPAAIAEFWDALAELRGSRPGATRRASNRISDQDRALTNHRLALCRAPCQWYDPGDPDAGDCCRCKLQPSMSGGVLERMARTIDRHLDARCPWPELRAKS